MEFESGGKRAGSLASLSLLSNPHSSCLPCLTVKEIKIMLPLGHRVLFPTWWGDTGAISGCEVSEDSEPGTASKYNWSEFTYSFN